MGEIGLVVNAPLSNITKPKLAPGSFLDPSFLIMETQGVQVLFFVPGQVPAVWATCVCDGHLELLTPSNGHSLRHVRTESAHGGCYPTLLAVLLSDNKKSK